MTAGKLTKFPVIPNRHSISDKNSGINFPCVFHSLFSVLIWAFCSRAFPIFVHTFPLCHLRGGNICWQGRKVYQGANSSGTGNRAPKVWAGDADDLDSHEIEWRFGLTVSFANFQAIISRLSISARQHVTTPSADTARAVGNPVIFTRSDRVPFVSRRKLNYIRRAKRYNTKRLSASSTRARFCQLTADAEVASGQIPSTIKRSAVIWCHFCSIVPETEWTIITRAFVLNRISMWTIPVR